MESARYLAVAAVNVHSVAKNDDGIVEEHALGDVLYRKAVLALERASNPEFSSFTAVKTLSMSPVKALLIYSDNDKLCRRTHYEILKKALDKKENIRLMLVKNKGHNPNYTEDALKLLSAFGKARAKLLRKKNASAEEKSEFVSSFDWNGMTAQDTAIWSTILEHLGN